MNTNPVLPRWIQWGTYPVLLVITLGLAAWDINHHQPGRLNGLIVGINAISLLLLELRYPMERRWRMEWRTAKRDLFFMACGITTMAFANWAFTTLAIALAPKEGLLHGLSAIPGAICALLVFQFLQYWLHRSMHETRGELGKRLWRIHRPHHVLERVYLLMHVRFHPIDGLLTRAIFILPLTWLGVNADAMYLMSVLIGLQGFMGHLNVDLRAGWFNYLFTGTELHRYHHSLEVSEGKNYGAISPIYDMLFGTFVYRPGQAPAALGVADQGPDADATLAHLAYPFQR